MAGRTVLWIAAAVVVPLVLGGVGVAWVGGSGGFAGVTSGAGPGSSAGGGSAGASSTVGSGSGAGGAVSSTVAGAGGPSGGSPASGVVALQGRIDALLVSSPLLFDGESAALRPGTADVVRRVGEILADGPPLPVRLVGHTADLPGPADRALELSRRRADAVATALVAAGVDPARISAEGAGDAAPLATPDASRRVEIVVG